jgi:spore coat protein H
MPVFLAVELIGDNYRFAWDESYDLQGDALRYDFQVSRTPEFAAADIVTEQLSLTSTEFFVPQSLLPAGSYYWRVTIRDQKDPAVNWQWPFDSYYDEVNDQVYFGMRDFVIE